MKCLLALPALAALGLTACETMNAPLTSGDFDPLRPPGSSRASVPTGPSFTAGQFVRASIDNTAFFRNAPKGNAEANKLLSKGTSMKVISTSGSNVKVELDTGDIGWVPAIMLEDPASAPAVAPATLPPGQYQVYPPLPGSGLPDPLPVIDPAGLPPEGSIPAVIDPDATPAPDGTPAVTPATGETFPAPPVEPTVEPNLESIPLPPNGEEE